MRVLVIGAGIVGVHVAHELVRRGAEVTLVDRDEPGSGTTEGSFAWVDVSHPGPPYVELRLMGLDAWARAGEALGDPPWLSLPGTLAWAAPGAAGDELDAHARRLDARGRGPVRLRAGEARERWPELIVPAGVERIYQFAGEGWVLTQPAIAALLERARSAGLRVRTGAEVTDLPRSGSRGRAAGAVIGSGEELIADVVVSCAGRWTGGLLARAGVEVPMVAPDPPASAAVGLVVRTTPAAHGLRSVLFADGLVVRPDGDGRLLLHSDEHDARIDVRTPATPPPAVAGELVALLRERLRGAEATEVERARICVRALPADRQPVVGTAREGLYVVATHSGVTLAPALAELVATEVLDRRAVSELAAYRPQRFGRRAA